MPSLGVVPGVCVSFVLLLWGKLAEVSSEVLELLLLLLRESLLREPYLMVLPVLRRIHWGMGRFCFCAFASFCLVRKDFWDCCGC
jgi:hypothetical protein